MQLSIFTDLALKTLMYTASQQRRVTNQEVTSAFNASKDHLRKVIHALSGWGYIDTFPGRSGGIELGRDAEEILLGELVRKCESGPLIDCLGQECILLPKCSLLGALNDAEAEFYKTLDNYTLASLMDNDVLAKLKQAS